MPSDVTTALGRLLTEPALRGQWRRDPAAVARALEADVASLDPDELEHQAETLLEKRFHEAAKLLPRTMAALGGRAERLFRDHAARYWPEGHRRHADDAIAFGRGLLERRLPHSRSELNRLRFAMGDDRFSLGFVDDAWVGGRARRALQILYRRRGAVRSLALYLGM